MSLGVAGARHLQALLGSLGRLARSPLSTALTLLVIAYLLLQPAIDSRDPKLARADLTKDVLSFS